MFMNNFKGSTKPIPQEGIGSIDLLPVIRVVKCGEGRGGATRRLSGGASVDQYETVPFTSPPRRAINTL